MTYCRPYCLYIHALRISCISPILCAYHTIYENPASYCHNIGCTYISHGTWSHAHISRAEQYTDKSNYFFSTSNIQFSTQICHSAFRYLTGSHNMRQIVSQICISTFVHLRRLRGGISGRHRYVLSMLYIWVTLYCAYSYIAYVYYCISQHIAYIS